MGSLVRGSPRPQPGPKMQVMRVKQTEFQHFTSYSPSFWGVDIHFVKGRSRECTINLPGKTCTNCGQWKTPKWKGYLLVKHHERDVVCFLELTPIASQTLERLVTEGETLRGFTFKVKKTKGGAQGRYVIEALYRPVDVSTLPPDRDPRETLKMLWTWEKKGGQHTEEDLK